MKIKWANILILCFVGCAGFFAGIATAVYVVATHIDIHVPAPAPVPARKKEPLLHAAVDRWTKVDA
jgi:hypothetical protein